ncbi:MAG: helix-turn-helix domain-containing protein [Bryobacteraceae bacterium]
MSIVVLIDNDPEAGSVLERTLTAQGYSVRMVTSLDEARRLNGQLEGMPTLVTGPMGQSNQPFSMREVERRAIEEALRANHGNRTHAARQLGISLRKLQYRLKEYGVSNGT